MPQYTPAKEESYSNDNNKKTLHTFNHREKEGGNMSHMLSLSGRSQARRLRAVQMGKSRSSRPWVKRGFQDSGTTL